MHRGLEIPEIAEMIAEQVGTHCHQSALGEEKASQRRDLSALARTSKTFLHPALNILWRAQDTIFPLLKCMPADLWDISVCPNEDGWPERVVSIHMNRTILFADWARPLFYLHRFKSFTVDDDDYLFEDLEFLEALSLCLPVQHIFPNLEKLCWFPEPGTAFHHVRLFLAPQIKELALGSIRSISDHCIFSDLAARCPSLTMLCVFSSLPVLSIPSISAFVKASTRLESLAVPGLDDTAFIHAATLPDLKNLKLRDNVAPISPLPFAEGRVYFPSLTKLTTPSMDDAITIISSLETCSLLCITMYGIRSRPTTTIARHSYATLARHCSHPYLRELVAQTDVLFPRTLSADQYSLYTVGGDILRPLFSFTNLVAVMLSHPVGFDLDDSVIRDMAAAWSRIERIFLTAASYAHVPSRVTLQGLSVFAKSCPLLRHLAMTFDATSVPKIGVIQKTQHSLVGIEVALSPITDPRRVANFLSAMFPHLREIGTLYDLVRRGDDSVSGAPKVVNGTHISNSHKIWKRAEKAL